MLGRIGGRRRRGRQRMRWLDGITNSMDVFEWTLGVSDGQGALVCCNSWGCKESDSTERLNWTELRRKIWNRSLLTFFRGSMILLTPWSPSLQNHETIVLLFKLLSLLYLYGSPRKLKRRQWHPTPGLLPGKSHGWKSLVGCSPWGLQESDTTERLHFHFSLSCIGEGNGNPLQCSCLENPRDGGAWWAAISWGLTESDMTEAT